jgi:protein-tyrosine phosphatase
VAGVPAATIADDYALSESRLGAYHEHHRARTVDPDERAAFRPPTAPHGSMVAVLDQLAARHGGVAAYLRSAGVAAADLAALRERFLE